MSSAPGLSRRRQRSLTAGADVRAVGEAQVGGEQRQRRKHRNRNGPGGTQRPPAPDHGRRDERDEGRYRPVRMRGGQQPACCRGRCDRRRRAQLERADEQDGKEGSHEREECVHPPEAAVDGQRSRGRCDRGRDDPAAAPSEPTTELEAERHRPDGEHDRQPAKRFRARVDPERDVAEHEVERSAAAIDEDGVEHLTERPHRDQPGDRLVLVEPLARNVGPEPIEKKTAEAAEHRDPAESPQDFRLLRRADSRPGRRPRPTRRRRRS